MARTRKLFLFILILFTLPAGSCPGDNVGPTGVDEDFDIAEEFDAVDEVSSAWLITGWVTIDRLPAKGVNATLTSASLPSPMTDSTGQDGYYNFDIPGPGTYRVTISGFPPDVRFDTLSNSAEILVPKDQFKSWNGPLFRGFREGKVEVLIFLENAYPAARFLEVGKEPGCDAAHWHSRAAVPLIAMRNDSGTGFDCAASTEFRKADPAPRQCGHGKIKEVPRQRITLHQVCLDEYVDRYGPLSP